jgi:hypothetical protein
MTNRHMDLGECYTGRRPDIRPVNVSLDREASDLLREWAGGTGTTLGRFLSRLVFEERARMQQEVVAAE